MSHIYNSFLLQHQMLQYYPSGILYIRLENIRRWNPRRMCRLAWDSFELFRAGKAVSCLLFLELASAWRFGGCVHRTEVRGGLGSNFGDMNTLFDPFSNVVFEVLDVCETLRLIYVRNQIYRNCIGFRSNYSFHDCMRLYSLYVTIIIINPCKNFIKFPLRFYFLQASVIKQQW